MTAAEQPGGAWQPARRSYAQLKQRSKAKSWVNRLARRAGGLVRPLLFDADAPRGLLRALLFDAYRQPRAPFGKAVFDRHGNPRRAFAGWMAGADDELRPLVGDLAFPELPANERIILVLLPPREVAARAALLTELSARATLLVLLTEAGVAPELPDGAAAMWLPAPAVSRRVFLKALAQRLAAYAPAYAVVGGAEAAELAAALEQRNVPVVALAAAAEAYRRQPAELGTLVGQASAVVLPSPAERAAALSLLPSLEGRVGVQAPAAGEALAPLVDRLGSAAAARVEAEIALVRSADRGRLTLDAAALRESIRAWRRERLTPVALGANKPRRPYAGFHPLIYAEAHAGACLAERRYPLAHWIEQGQPAGPWAQPVIGPPTGALAPTALKVMLHSHFHYVDLAPEFFGRLARNAARPDLFLTTGSAEKARLLERAAAGYAGRVEILQVPNRGRDAGPFFTGLRESLLSGGYDVAVHVHGKKSETSRTRIGDGWRDFLWENTLGGQHAMLDATLAAFAADPRLGLAYPDDPHLVGWARNRRAAELLCRDMGITEELTTFVEFPIGNMFTARPAALAPILDLDLQWTDYPPEPLADDGTVIHGLERLMPAIARKAGYGVASIHVPGTSWD
ncbi:rhamnan synthesis F family protein [Ancylobacter sp. Lp-2]|uniref:rhamnan synthesis F family protein n=1 Tax=Ancylobacter sp. Lp-2 TaxID=2881339 RepID=UPI001E51957A|nr:rhamnan synthesis F family protein [Ancylobacter sp. Lp-2]MCB4767978.1 rhamnan synthesis F family protein [Ancylobacter sp. Lp-2]